MPFSTKNLHDLRLKSGQNRDNFFKIFGVHYCLKMCIQDMGGVSCRTMRQRHIRRIRGNVSAEHITDHVRGVVGSSGGGDGGRGRDRTDDTTTRRQPGSADHAAARILPTLTAFLISRQNSNLQASFRLQPKIIHTKPTLK
jgi:hypothetical protein